jgi:Xaa-Pro aminopeptidase
MSTRAERLAIELRKHELDGLIVSTPVNVRYLTGYTGSNGLALITADSSQPDIFYTDFRYASSSAQQVSDSFSREIVTSGDLLAAASGTLTGQLSRSVQRVGFEQDHLTVARHTRLSELLVDGPDLLASTGVLEGLRMVKDGGEIDRIRAAAQLADQALRFILEQGLVGRAERDVAIDLELEMRRLGADGPSFPSIVASGAHGALPHAEPRSELIAEDVLVTIDWGALHDGYCSDCTRTYATGEHVSEHAREIYELVLRAQMAGLAATEAGLSGKQVDAAAREVIEHAGHGEHFGHGLGHGVGMEIHEGPRLSVTAGDRQLLAGNVVTVEPGVYIPGQLGVRIEDLVVITEQGHEVLSALPKVLTVIS